MNQTKHPLLEQYHPYRNLPALVGLGSFSQAADPGLSVEESVGRLKRHHWSLRRLHQIVIARLTAEPIYELKMAFSYHGHLFAEHISALRERVGEMREPPLGLDKTPDEGIDRFFDEILNATKTEELLLGLYEFAVPSLIRGLERHLKEGHLLADQPSRRLCKLALFEMREVSDYGTAAVKALVNENHREEAKGYLAQLQDCLNAIGDLDGTQPKKGQVPSPYYSSKPYVYDGKPKRDERFQDPYNQGVNSESFLYDEKQPADAKVLMMFFKRLREIDVPEMMASIIAETPNKPWNYYRDLTRQLWDEARHAMMGEVGFVSVGVDWSKSVVVNFSFSYFLNEQLSALDRHAVLYYIEQGLMPKTGKRYEWEVSQESGNPLAATFQDFDWADEVLHSRVGRDWYVTQMKSSAEAIHHGDVSWARVGIDWDGIKAKGLTQHRNWWPDLYDAFCKAQGKTPDPKVLGYATTYQSIRADLKKITASA